MNKRELKQMIKGMIEESKEKSPSCVGCKYYVKRTHGSEKFGCLKGYEIGKEYNIPFGLNPPEEIIEGELASKYAGHEGEDALFASSNWATWIFKRKGGLTCKFMDKEL